MIQVGCASRLEHFVEPDLERVGTLLPQALAVVRISERGNGQPVLDDAGQPVFRVVTQRLPVAIDHVSAQVVRVFLRTDGLDRVRQEAVGIVNVTRGSFLAVAGYVADPVVTEGRGDRSWPGE